MIILENYLKSKRVQKALSTKPGEEGFSLVELVIVIAVLSILSAVAIPAFIGYMVVVETLFAWPGIGNLLLKSVSNRDYPIVICSVFVLCTITLSIFFVTDILYSIIDPRIKF